MIQINVTESAVPKNVATIDKPNLNLTGNTYDKQGVKTLVDDKFSEVQMGNDLGVIISTDTPPAVGLHFGKVFTAGTFTKFKDAENAALIFTQLELDVNFCFISVNNNVAAKVSSLKPKIDLQQNKSYYFHDAFFDNKGWFSDPEFPLTPNFSNALILNLTAAKNQAVKIISPYFFTGESYNVKIKVRKTTAIGITVLGCGFTISGYDSPIYREFIPTLDWQVFELNLTASMNLRELFIACHSTKNTGDSIEIAYIFIDEKENATLLSSVSGIFSENFESALFNSNGFVQLQPQEYSSFDVARIPNNTLIRGVKGRTIINFSDHGDFMTFNETHQNIRFEDIIFDGGNPFMPVVATPSEIKSKAGIATQNCFVFIGGSKNIEIENCEIRNFSGCGIKSEFTHVGIYGRTQKINNNLIHNNYLGAFFGERSEYHQFSGNTFFNNQINCWIEGGNNFGTNNHFNGGAVGLVVSGFSNNNDSHGGISNSTVNHNLSYSLFSVSINNGFTFNGCHFFDGDIYIENTKGLNIQSGIIDAEIISVNESAGSNMISNNQFAKSYGGGEIVGSVNNFTMKNNVFIDGSGNSSINN